MKRVARPSGADIVPAAIQSPGDENHPLAPEAAEIYGRLDAEPRRKGRLIQQVDMQIAAIALALGQCTVVSEDSDLFAVPGLSVENWAVR